MLLIAVRNQWWWLQRLRPPLDFLLCLRREPLSTEAVGEAYRAPIREPGLLLAAGPEKAYKFGHLWTSIITMLRSYFAALASYVNPKKKKKASDSISFITLMTQNHFR